MGYTAKSSNGSIYNAASEKAIHFIDNAAIGSTMTGGDGSSWTKNADGSTTVVARDGVTTTFNAAAPADSFRVNNVITGGISGDERGGQIRQAQLAQRLLEQYDSRRSACARQLAAQQAAQEAAVNKAVNALESQRSGTERQYADLFRQLYVDKMKSRKNLNQQLAARGVTGGAAETTALGYDTAYEDALRQGEQGRSSAIAALDRAIADTRLTGDIESANAAAQAAREQTSAYADALKYLISRQDAIDARQESYAREDSQRAAALARQLAEQRREAEEAAEREAERAAKPTLTVAQVNAAIKAGVLTDTVLAAYEYYYGAPYGG